MKSALEQSIKEKIKVLARERETSFSELWTNLILERFLTRVSRSPYRYKFVLKGGTLLAKYLPLGRETQDLDFFLQKLANSEQSLKKTLQAICDIDPNDSFTFEIINIKPRTQVQLAYTGAEIALLAKFGATRTPIRMDLGFGDIVNPIDFSIELITTSKGPLFENKISLRCYPKEFIFAEKLEAAVIRGETNTRMKDFHDLHSLIFLGSLDESLTGKAIQLVFHHRKTPLENIPIAFNQTALEMLGKNWHLYRRKLKTKKDALPLPEFMEDLILAINQWLNQKVSF